MISPASTKKGMANREKLSAPLTSVCARICTSKISIQNINEMPHSNNAQAMGIPMAIAPNKLTINIRIVIVRLLVGFGWGHLLTAGINGAIPAIR